MRTLVTTLDRRVARGRAYDARMHAAENPIVPEGAKLELLFTRTAKTQRRADRRSGRGARRQHLFHRHAVWRRPGMILRFDPATRKVTVFTDDSGKANGLTCDANGDLVACEGADDGGRRVSRWDIKTGKSQTIADSIRASGSTRPTTCASTPRGASISPIRATWATSRASSSIGPSIASIPTARWSK